MVDDTNSTYSVQLLRHSSSQCDEHRSPRRKVSLPMQQNTRVPCLSLQRTLRQRVTVFLDQCQRTKTARKTVKNADKLSGLASRAGKRTGNDYIVIGRRKTCRGLSEELSFQKRPAALGDTHFEATSNDIKYSFHHLGSNQLGFVIAVVFVVDSRALTESSDSEKRVIRRQSLRISAQNGVRSPSRC